MSADQIVGLVAALMGGMVLLRFMAASRDALLEHEQEKRRIEAKEAARKKAAQNAIAVVGS